MRAGDVLWMGGVWTLSLWSRRPPSPRVNLGRTGLTISISGTLWVSLFPFALVSGSAMDFGERARETLASWRRTANLLAEDPLTEEAPNKKIA